jgi:hypothetical protein
MISHPLGNLTVEDGDLWEVYQGPPLKRTRYMTAPPFSIVGKGKITELHDNICRYEFQTNQPLEQNWGFLLQEHVPGVHWEPGKPILEIDCIPANLTSQYQHLKSGIAETNEHYLRERDRLIQELRKMREDAASAAKLRAQRREGVKQGFDKLEP